jgi:serine protease DegQ
MEDLRTRLALMPVDTTVTLTFLRDGQKQDVSVTIGAAPAEQTANAGDTNESTGQIDNPALQGATFGEGQASNGSKGVKVTAVEQNSPAAQVGLKANDVIVAVNRQPVQSVADLRKAVVDGGRQIVLVVDRGGERVLLVI